MHLQKISFVSKLSYLAGLEIKKLLRSPLATDWKNVDGRCKFLVTSLFDVNDATHSMARSFRFDCLKISQAGVSINLEVNCDLAHFL